MIPAGSDQPNITSQGLSTSQHCFLAPSEEILCKPASHARAEISETEISKLEKSRGNHLDVSRSSTWAHEVQVLGQYGRASPYSRGW